MKNNVKNKEYSMEEAVSYYILGYKRYEQNIEQNGIGDVLKNIAEVAQENIDKKQIKGVNIELLTKIDFDWSLSSNDFIAYATCIFYDLMNKEIQITDEKIVKEFLKELHLYHPRNIMKEASEILESCFPELNN